MKLRLTLTQRRQITEATPVGALFRCRLDGTLRTRHTVWCLVRKGLAKWGGDGSCYLTIEGERLRQALRK